jgi:hypothetical protein
VAGLVRVGVIAIDGTKIAANASLDANRGYEWIVREILEEAEEIDRAADERYGEARGDELPEQLRRREGRRAALRAAKRRLGAEQESQAPASRTAAEPSLLEGRAIGQGRRGWLRAGRRRLDERRAQQARPIARSREARLAESKRRLEEELEAERSANEADEAYRWRGVMRDGRRFGGEPRPSKPYEPPATPTATINTTDHDSRIVRTQGPARHPGPQRPSGGLGGPAHRRRRDHRRVARLRPPRADGRGDRRRA